MSTSNCCFLTCIQVSQEAGHVVWYPHLFQNFPYLIVIHTVKGFGIVNKAEIDVFLELSCFFDDPEDVGNLISGSSPFSKTSLNIWKFMVHIPLKPGLENFEHYFASVWDPTPGTAHVHQDRAELGDLNAGLGDLITGLPLDGGCHSRKLELPGWAGRRGWGFWLLIQTVQTSLDAKWLGLCALTVGGIGFIPCQGARTPQGMQHNQKIINIK